MKVQITNRLEESDINVFIKMANEKNRSLNYVIEKMLKSCIKNELTLEEAEEDSK